MPPDDIPYGWKVEICPHAHKHWVLSQTALKGCGLAVSGMLIHRMLGKQYSEVDLLIRWTKLGQDYPSRDDNVKTLLNDYGVRGVMHKHLSSDRMKDLVRAASIARPVIAAVVWQGAFTGHWVMIESRTTQGFGSSSSYCVCDPLKGVVNTSLTDGKVQVKSAIDAKDPHRVEDPKPLILQGLKYHQDKTTLGVVKGALFVPE
jgi:hypothetical protein